MVWWRYHTTPLEVVNHSGVTVCLGWPIPKIIVKEIDNKYDLLGTKALKHTGEKFPLPFSTNQEKKKEPEQKNYILLEGPGRTLSVKEDGLRFWPSVPGHNRRHWDPGCGTCAGGAGLLWLPKWVPLQCHFPSFNAGWHQEYKESGPRLHTRRGSCRPGRVRRYQFVYGLYAVGERKILFQKETSGNGRIRSRWGYKIGKTLCKARFLLLRNYFS